jgi:hypothetical protein
MGRCLIDSSSFTAAVLDYSDMNDMVYQSRHRNTTSAAKDQWTDMRPAAAD